VYIVILLFRVGRSLLHVTLGLFAVVRRSFYFVRLKLPIRVGLFQCLDFVTGEDHLQSAFRKWPDTREASTCTSANEPCTISEYERKYRSPLIIILKLRLPPYRNCTVDMVRTLEGTILPLVACTEFWLFSALCNVAYVT
jgi:hypothetical protein